MSKIDILLMKMRNGAASNNREFLECLIEMDDRIKDLEERVGS